VSTAEKGQGAYNGSSDIRQKRAHEGGELEKAVAPFEPGPARDTVLTAIPSMASREGQSNGEQVGVKKSRSKNQRLIL